MYIHMCIPCWDSTWGWPSLFQKHPLLKLLSEIIMAKVSANLSYFMSSVELLVDCGAFRRWMETGRNGCRIFAAIIWKFTSKLDSGFEYISLWRFPRVTPKSSILAGFFPFLIIQLLGPWLIQWSLAARSTCKRQGAQSFAPSRVQQWVPSWMVCNGKSHSNGWFGDPPNLGNLREDHEDPPPKKKHPSGPCSFGSHAHNVLFKFGSSYSSYGLILLHEALPPQPGDDFHTSKKIAVYFFQYEGFLK